MEIAGEARFWSNATVALFSAVVSILIARLVLVVSQRGTLRPPANAALPT